MNMGNDGEREEQERLDRQEEIRKRRAAWGHRGDLAPRNAKLTPRQRQEIGRRLREGEGAQELATEFHITAGHVYSLRTYY
jgi:DNA-binding NarL/FixJ family response regulator